MKNAATAAIAAIRPRALEGLNRSGVTSELSDGIAGMRKTEDLGLSLEAKLKMEWHKEGYAVSGLDDEAVRGSA